ncbi:hypothetical protein [Lysinibacillus capsici]|uniref:hypothetical protein n=1 Tax=Lysinibacillus capsici TaxID=2115968 RepID=UPI000E20A777|nr:hypothetical protein [Lysinibacillus capsici]RDV27735.1 hypothetical protein C7B89_19325 [Lysinibacillus capsici]
MKKIIYTVSLVLCLGLVGCGTTSEKEEDAKPKSESTPPVEKTSSESNKSVEYQYQKYYDSMEVTVRQIINNNALLDQYQQELNIGTISLDDFSLLITYELIPANDALLESVESFKAADEVVDTHETLITMLNKLHYALLEISGAIDTSDSSRMVSAIEYLDEVKKYEREFSRDIKKHVKIDEL